MFLFLCMGVILQLKTLMYHTFVIAAAKTKINLARLPLTADAAHLHYTRSYHQVQTWLGNKKDPLQWGWMQTLSGFFPRKTEKDPTPEFLLQCILCTFKKCSMNAGKQFYTVLYYVNIAMDSPVKMQCHSFQTTRLKMKML